MSTEPEPKAGIKSVVSKLVTIVSETSQDFFSAIKKRVKVYNLYPGVPDLNISSLKLDYSTNIRVKSVRQIYVLVRSYFKLAKMPKIKVFKFKFNQPALNLKTFPLKSCTASILSYMKSLNVDITTNNLMVIFVPKIGSAKDFTFNGVDVLPMQVEPFCVPTPINQPLTFTCFIKKRSEVFASNLPMEKKPVSIMLFTQDELGFFKQKLGQKQNIHRRHIKILHIYDKFNIRNLQNIKYDPKSQHVFCNYKPQNQLTDNNDFAFLVVGLRKDNNTSLSTMVTYSEFESIRNK